ncbi:MAG: hypothetical protein ABI625_03565 [bacterium]
MSSQGNRVRGVPVEVPCAALLVVGPFWTWLHLERYSIYRTEALVMSALLIAVGMAYGWLTHRLARWPVLPVIMTAVLLMISLDLLTSRPGWRAVIFCILLAGTWAFRDHITRIILAMGVAYLASTLLVGARPAEPVWKSPRPPAARDVPPIVHLIADEHGGIEGLPTEIALLREERNALTRFYTDRGFRLFTRAYSRYHMTMDAIPNEFNFTESATKYGWVDDRDPNATPALRENRYFERLGAMGYETHIYQPPFLDYCTTTHAPSRSCHTESSVRRLHVLNLSWMASTWYLGTIWLTQHSSLLLDAHDSYDRLRGGLATRGVSLREWHWPNMRLGQAGAVSLARHMASDIATTPQLRGAAYVGHLLLPHLPYLMNERCEGRDHITDGMVPDVLGEERLTAEQRRERYVLYATQLECFTHLVDTIAANLAARSGSDAIMIVQGDHGSRIGRAPSVHEPLSRESFTDFYSALFAIRAPGITPGVDTTTVALNELLNRYSQSGFRDVTMTGDASPFVYVGEADTPTPHLVRATVPVASPQR